MSPTTDDEDLALVARVQTGDISAFETLFRKYYEPLVTFARLHASSVDAAIDAVCDVFTLLYEHRTTWRLTSTARGYLFRAVRNQVSRQHRTTMRENARNAMFRAQREDAADFRDSSEHTRPADEALIADESAYQLRTAIAQGVQTLSASARTIIMLRMHRGMSYEEIADILESTPAAVKMQLSRALKALRARLAELGL